MAGALTAIATPVIGDTQESRKRRRVGFFHIGSREPFAKLLLAFEERMAELGYSPGKDLSIVELFADGPSDLSRVADELVRSNVDLLLVQSNVVANAALRATTTIPIVAAVVTTPVEAGFALSLSRPGKNITGITSDVGLELWAKRLEYLQAAVPGVSRIALFWSPERGREAMADAAEEAARSLGVGLYREEFRTAGDFPGAFASMAKRAGAVLVAGHAVTVSNRAALVRLAAQHRLPAGYPWREAVEIGGLMSYGVSFRESYRRAADYADRIFRARSLETCLWSSQPSLNWWSTARPRPRSGSPFHRH
jgi:putative ABC transport system substrate-binding protein